MFGLQKTSLIDFPGQVAAVIFFQGCNLRCPYCHNGDLVTRSLPADELFSYSRLLDFLHKRRKTLGGVVISGGEPLMHPFSRELAETIRKMGYLIKLDTNGLFPEQLKEFPFDYCAMDLKTTPEKYNKLKFGKPAEPLLKKSITYLVSRNECSEFRLTAAPDIFEKNDIPRMAELLKGARKLYIQPFRPDKTLQPEWQKKVPYSHKELESFTHHFNELSIPAEIR